MYILECTGGLYCTGSTTDLDRRLKEHSFKYPSASLRVLEIKS
jgi:predicted GIY-YIG superfamily endonuclease